MRADYDPILRTVARAVFYLVVLFALHLFWRGHSAPGGGFVAGLMTAVAVVLYRMAFGSSPVQLEPVRLLPWGLGLAALTGTVPMLLGRSFLTSAHGHLETPLTGEFEWASAVAFDLGVYLVVVGATLGIVSSLAQAPSEDERPGSGGA